MIKSTLFIIMIAMMSLSAGARSLITHTRAEFVHLNQQKQNELVIKLMELVVEIEDKYEHDTRTYGYNQERFEKFQKAMKEITSILSINSAYADDSAATSEWNALLGKYTEAQSNRNLCLFAGWIAETYKTTSGSTRCKHPSVRNSFTTGYPSSNASGCRPENKKIQCNPLIFGYKSQDDRSLFCVTTEDSAHNSSYLCMKSALEEGDVEARLKFLRERLSDGNNYEAARGFVYKSCLCPAAGNRNVEYQNYMRPHQTCYGLMEMMRATSFEHCDGSPTIFSAESADIFTNLKTHMENVSRSDIGAINRQYKSFVNTQLATPQMRQELRMVCEGIRTTYDCTSVTCNPGTSVEGSTEPAPLSCDFVIEKKVGEESSNVPLTNPQSLPAIGHTGAFSVTGTVDGKSQTLTCPMVTINQPEPEVALSCEIKCDAVPASGPAPASSDSAPAARDGSNPRPGSADQTQGSPAAGGTPATPVARACTVTFKKNGEDYTPNPAVEGFSITNETEKKFNLTLEGESAPKEVTCAVPAVETAPEEPTGPENKPTLKVEIKDPGATIYKIKATVNPEDHTGWIFTWELKDTGENKVDKGWEQDPPPGEATIEGLAGGSGSGEDDDESQNDTEGQDTTPETPTSNAKDISQARKAFDYQVCGKLTKGDETVGPECVKVDKLGAAPAADKPKTPTNVNPNLQSGGNQQMRGSSDTSAAGIN